MGYQNVHLAYARWVHLPDRSFRLLTFMALRAKDEDDPPLFWEGREACAYALGRMTPNEPASSDVSKRADEYRKARRADFEAVKTAARGLLKAGVIAVDKPASPRNNTRYSLHLLAATGQGEPVERGRVSLSTGQGEPVERGRPDLPLKTNLPTGGNSINTTERSNSTFGGTSPGADEIDYATASKFLQRFPDHGMTYLERIADEVGGLKERVIAAAVLAMSERNSA